MTDEQVTEFESRKGGGGGGFGGGKDKKGGMGAMLGMAMMMKGTMMAMGEDQAWPAAWFSVLNVFSFPSRFGRNRCSRWQSSHDCNDGVDTRRYRWSQVTHRRRRQEDDLRDHLQARLHPIAHSLDRTQCGRTRQPRGKPPQRWRRRRIWRIRSLVHQLLPTSGKCESLRSSSPCQSH